MKDGKLTHTYSMMGVFVFKQVAEEDLPSGEVTVRMEFAADEAKPATGGEVTLFIDDRPVGKGRMDHTVPIRFSGYAGMDIGRDNGGVVDLATRTGSRSRSPARSRRSCSTSSRTCPTRTSLICTPRRTAGRRAHGLAGLGREERRWGEESTTDVLIGGYLSRPTRPTRTTRPSWLRRGVGAPSW